MAKMQRFCSTEQCEAGDLGASTLKKCELHGETSTSLCVILSIQFVKRTPRQALLTDDRLLSVSVPMLHMHAGQVSRQRST